MNNTQWLWKELRDLFETDDGSLTEINIKFKKSEAIVHGFALLRKRANKTIPENASFWSKVREEDQLVNSVPNAASLVVDDKAQPFHIVLSGIKSNGIEIPDLGVFIFQMQITIDYKMGHEWGPEELEAFFELLRDIAACDENSSVVLQEGDIHEKLFAKSWQQWTAEHTDS